MQTGNLPVCAMVARTGRAVRQVGKPNGFSADMQRALNVRSAVAQRAFWIPEILGTNRTLNIRFKRIVEFVTVDKRQ